jgi:two-component system, sensor histidine kinase and response regulator
MSERTRDNANPSPSHSTAKNKVFDADAALQRLEGDAELFLMLRAIFQEDSVVLFEKLSAALASGDLASVERAAHSLKGLSANFEATEAAEVALQIEAAARARQPAGLAPMVADLSHQLERLRLALAQWEAA